MSPLSDTPVSRAPEVWTREEAIARLRIKLLTLADGEQSMCRVAARLGIFCGGFRRWPDAEFFDRWTAVIGQSTQLTRPQLERVADLWQLTEQLRLRVPLACDAQTLAPGACRGWNEFSNEDLEVCCKQILGRDVAVPELLKSTEAIASRNDSLTRSRLPDLNLATALGTLRMSAFREEKGLP